ncbi:MAG: methylated-DNA--[protein]-cysteine S-methyltransferase [Bacillota bacterium]|nr:MAG: methylated-DNA--[protein]-cysteine S-methyltransferase [Bacillota bacterium]
MIVRVSTRLGVIPLEFEGERLLRVWLPNDPEAPAAGPLLAEDGPEPEGLPGWVRRLARDLVAYAAGAPVDLNAWGERVDLREMTSFRQRVYRALLGVPRGETRTYGRLAAEAGFPRAARAVGGAMAANPVPLVIPCHRVTAAGDLGLYGGGTDLKRRLLQLGGALPP